MAHSELPRELARAATGAQADILEFVDRYGLLGFSSAGKTAAARFSNPGAVEKDPLSWFVSHARTVQTALQLLGSLTEGDDTILDRVNSLTEMNEDESKRISYAVARRGDLLPVRKKVYADEPRLMVLAAIAGILNKNLSGVSRWVGVSENCQELESSFVPTNLADMVYWHLADAAVGG